MREDEQGREAPVPILEPQSSGSSPRRLHMAWNSSFSSFSISGVDSPSLPVLKLWLMVVSLVECMPTMFHRVPFVVGHGEHGWLVAKIKAMSAQSVSGLV